MQRLHPHPLPTGQLLQQLGSNSRRLGPNHGFDTGVFPLPSAFWDQGPGDYDLCIWVRDNGSPHRDASPLGCKPVTITLEMFRAAGQ
jgi:hypothetical protein